MKRFLCMVLLCILASGLALTAKETVHLKNGSVINGVIIEETPGVSLKIQTSDGNIFVYNMDEIATIQRNVNSEPDMGCNVRHRRLDFSVATGFNVATKGGSGNIPVDITVSKRFSPFLSAGLSTGIEIGTGDGAKPVIPIAAEVRAYMPLRSTKVTPFAGIRLGYAINTAESYTVGSGKHKVTVDPPNAVLFSVMPGVRIPLSHRTDIDLAIGYQHYITTGSDGSGSGAFAIRAGFNFHASTANHAKKPRHINPVWDSGIEIGVEASGIGEYGGSVLLGYKLNPKWSFALGAGASYMDYYEIPEGTKYLYAEPGCTGEAIPISAFRCSDSKSLFFNLYVRAQYRMLDKKFSPIASIDLGYTTDRYDNGVPDTEWRNIKPWEREDIDMNPNGVFVRPALGVSMRMGSNSYLELRAGYNFRPGVPSLNLHEDVSGSVGKYDYQSLSLERKGKSLSNFFVGLSYKHTFSLFSRH